MVRPAGYAGGYAGGWPSAGEKGGAGDEVWVGSAVGVDDGAATPAATPCARPMPAPLAPGCSGADDGKAPATATTAVAEYASGGATRGGAAAGRAARGADASSRSVACCAVTEMNAERSRRVVRGGDWQWGEQDGGEGGTGTLTQDEDEGWWRVKWEVCVRVWN